MALKMKELVAQTGESKSTILYYLKEGLLPEPQKPKPNVHLYDESCVPRIRLIKYLQEHFSYSIAQIRHIFEHNAFDFDASFESIIAAVAMLGEEEARYDKETFLELAEIDEATLRRYEAAGYLVPNGAHYGTKELQAVDILKRAEAMGLKQALLDAYVRSARELARLENDTGDALLESKKDEAYNERYALMFDVILKLKPYLFNRYTVKEHGERVKNSEQ